MSIYVRRAWPSNMLLDDYLRLGTLEPGSDDQSRGTERAFFLIATLVEELHKAGVLDADAIARVAGDGYRKIELVSERHET